MKGTIPLPVCIAFTVVFMAPIKLKTKGIDLSDCTMYNKCTLGV
jgi:hypothetical protein